MTRRRGRSSGTAEPGTRLPPFLIAGFIGAALALFAIAAPPAWAGVEEEDLAATLSEYRGALEDGRKHLAELDYPEAIDAFSKLIEAYKTGRIPMVTPEARQIVARAYEGRALTFANLGKNQDASADFEALIRFDPSHQVELKGTSQKIVSLYMSVRKKTVGVLSIETDPIGSEILLNDQSLGLAPLNDREYVAGTYRIQVSRVGFDPVGEEIRIEAGQRLAKKYRLVPNARDVLVTTVPRDVRVLIDGTDRGATFGTAGLEYDEVAKELGVPLADVSGPLLVGNLKPGERDMTLRKECFEDLLVRLSIDVDPNNNTPLAYKPFVLKSSRGNLEIVSEPAGAEVILDGKPAGPAPVSLSDVCSGPHDLILEKEGLGRYSGTVEAKKDETVRVVHRLRLSLAVFDLRPGLKEEETLGAALKGSERYNILRGNHGIPAEVLDRVGMEIESAQGKGLSDRTLRDLFASLKVDLVALALVAGPIQEQAEILVYGPMHSKPDRVMVVAAGGEALGRLRALLDAEVPVRRPWVGLKLIDVFGRPHPVVLSVPAGGPAAAAGIAAGDLLVSVGPNPVASVEEFHKMVGSARAGDETTVTVERAGQTKEWKLKYQETPVLLPVKDPGLFYNKAIVDLRQASMLASGPAERSYAWLNVGIALMHFGQWKSAIREAFRKADLPDGAGISKGTIRYLTALCYDRLGLKNEASAAYTEAASSGNATLGSHDGPLLAPAAHRRAGLLTGSNK